MTAVTHQTIKLSKGRHRSPEDGACVMELASMLAGEPFSDHPASVSPVIGSCLRAYNDWIDDDRRQDLYAYAAKVVGTRVSPEAQRGDVDRAIEERRVERVIEWAREVASRSPFRRRLLRYLCPPVLSPQLPRIGHRVIQAAAHLGPGGHQEVLALIDELVAMGPQPLEVARMPAVNSARTAPSSAPATTSAG